MMLTPRVAAGAPAVAPFTGAWIEISKRALKQLTEARSHPSRVRGLKFFRVEFLNRQVVVAPFTGAWIEITENDTESSN